MTSPEPSSARSPAVRARNLRMVFRDVVAVDDVSMDVSAGAILGLVGPNGSGKTTTLRILSGILPSQTGSIEIASFDMDRQPIEAKQRLAYVPDDPKMFEGLTVWEHIRFTAAMYQVENYEDAARNLLERFALSDKRTTVCSELSRGMRHKLGICCALLHEPRLLILDEPLAGLDPQAIRELKDRIRQRTRAGGAAIISSHLLHLIEDLCSDLLVLQRGRARYLGSLASFRDSPSAGGQSFEDVFIATTSNAERNPDESP